MITVSELYIYPVKSFKGIQLQAAQLHNQGFYLDRRWMLVDEQGIFVSQRTVSELLFFEPYLTDDFLIIKHIPTQEQIQIPIKCNWEATTKVQIWDDTCIAKVAPLNINNWFNALLPIKVSLVFMPDEAERMADKKYTTTDYQVSFADAYPYLLISEASLAELNRKSGEEWPINRFRPNIVVKGCLPQAEEKWLSFTIGKHLFHGVKPCARCNVITINQITSIAGKEPLATLATYKRKDNKVIFGQNCVANATDGLVKIGDELIVLKEKE